MSGTLDHLAFAILIGLTFWVIYVAAIEDHDYEKTLPEPYAPQKIEDIRRCIDNSNNAEKIKECRLAYNAAYKDYEK